MKIKLKYLFEAEFYDGSRYLQNIDDVSVKFPPVKLPNGELQGKSCMSDIQEDVDNYRIKRFSLIEVTPLFPKKYTVDLTDGHFEINGQRIEVEGDRPLPLGVKVDYKLIYFRVRRPFITRQVNTKTGQILSEKKGELPVKYMIGWEVTLSGKNYIQKILVQ